MMTDGRTNKFIDDESEYDKYIHYGVVSYIFVGIFVFALFVSVIFVAKHLSIKHENALKAKWNNGICTECSGDYEFFQAVGHGSSTSYIYKCDSCGKIVEFENIMEKEN